MHETDTGIVITAELPGMEEKENGYAYSERSYGSFERRIAIDTEIVSDKVDAAFKNGVLTVTLPKKPEARKHFKRVPIHGSGEERKTEKKAAQRLRGRLPGGPVFRPALVFWPIAALALSGSR